MNEPGRTVRITRRETLAGAFASFTFFTAIAGQFWRNLLGWWGFSLIVGALVVGSIWLLVAVRPKGPGRINSWRQVPKSVIAFVVLAIVSIIWSAYPGGSAIGLAILLATVFIATSLAISLPWSRLLAALATAFKWVLGLSVLFEIVLAVFIRRPVLPLFPDFDVHGKLPDAFYWSTARLLKGGPIEGIVANRNLLGMAALLAVIVFATLLTAEPQQKTTTPRPQRTRASLIGWIVVSVVLLLLTRSTTVFAAGALVIIVLVFAVWARRSGGAKRTVVYLTGLAGTVMVSAAILVLKNPLLSLFGKSEDLTGRSDIWGTVAGLAAQRPLFGWGWVGYWIPWEKPFQGLIVRKGVTYLQAHDAWLDIWLQLGIIGLVVFGAFVLTTLGRSWFIAVDQPVNSQGFMVPYSSVTLLPLLLIVALLGQAFTESRLLIEIGLVLLTIIAWHTKQIRQLPDTAQIR